MVFCGRHFYTNLPKQVDTTDTVRSRLQWVAQCHSASLGEHSVIIISRHSRAHTHTYRRIHRIIQASSSPIDRLTHGGRTVVCVSRRGQSYVSERVFSSRFAVSSAGKLCCTDHWMRMGAGSRSMGHTVMRTMHVNSLSTFREIEREGVRGGCVCFFWFRRCFIFVKAHQKMTS